MANGQSQEERWQQRQQRAPEGSLLAGGGALNSMTKFSSTDQARPLKVKMVSHWRTCSGTLCWL